jgi:6-phosphofructokinase 1
MCSGGDAAGMNPAIKKFVDYAHKLNQETYFIYDGLEGLIDNRIKKASHKDVAGIMHIGGTILRSSRSKRFFEYEYRQQAAFFKSQIADHGGMAHRRENYLCT